MKSVSKFLLVSSLLALAGCSTFEGLQNDISRGYNSIAGTVSSSVASLTEQRKKLPVYDGACPPVSVRPDLTKLVDFSNPEKPSDSTKVSNVEIRGVQNTCRLENGAIVMQIDIALYGETGPKARMQAGDKPSFAYPYFIAVTDEQGIVVSKEIFAASLAYGAEQKDINQTESVFQTMPVPDKDAGENYKVIVGLQLTPEQLAYNQNKLAAAPAPESKTAKN